jgi:hypothetical protein
MNRYLLCHLSLGLAVLSAETPQDDTQSATLRLPDPASIRFTPPPPPKDVPRMSVKGSTTADFGTHRITILRGEPSTLPDIPKPPPPVETTLEISSAPAEHVRFLLISGSTFGDNLSHVEIWNPVTHTRHTAWCGWDVSLIAPIHEITYQGKVHAILMGVGSADITKAKGPGVEVKPGSILVPDGDEYTASILTSLRETCLANLSQLRKIKAAREQYQKDSDEWKAANPPRSQNHTIWIKPHRGSRYLPKTNGEPQEGTR